MNILHKPILVIFLLAFFLQINAQVIPKEWEGQWIGEVNIWAYNQKIESFPMSLEIIAVDSIYNFTINYQRNIDSPDIRNYQLINIDNSKGHLAIDEKNSIVLDTYFNDNCLYTIFSGMGSDLQTRICLVGQNLNYEITSNYSTSARNSGGQIINNDTIPEIKSYSLYHLMKATLRKKE